MNDSCISAAKNIFFPIKQRALLAEQQALTYRAERAVQ